jgi:hypothetical protein
MMMGASLCITLCSMLAGTLTALVRARWAAAAMGAAGTLLTLMIGGMLPRARRLG